MNTTTTTKVTPKDFFLWLGAMVTLYVSTISFLALLFNYIDQLFADPLSYYDPYSSGIRFAMAALFVIFPLFLFLFRVLQKDIRSNPQKKELWIRRWLIFLSLFVAGITLVVDLIILLNNFLGGEELTTAFLLKVLAVFIVIGAGFLYFLKDIQGYWESREKTSKMIGAITAVVVLLTLIAGFFIIGSPQTQRDMRLDRERVSDLQSIQWQIVNHYQRTGKLPENLSTLEDPIAGYQLPTDPQTNAVYEYAILNSSTLTFELCTTFAAESAGLAQASKLEPSLARPGLDDNFWKHDAGRVCFERTIDPEQFPVTKN